MDYIRMATKQSDDLPLTGKVLKGITAFLDIASDAERLAMANNTDLTLGILKIWSKNSIATSAGVAEKGCRLMLKLTSISRDQVVYWGNHGACEAVAEALKVHRAKASLAEAASNAVACLADAAENCCVRLERADACELIQQVLVGHRENSAIVMAACKAVTALSARRGCHIRFVVADTAIILTAIGESKNSKLSQEARKAVKATQLSLEATGSSGCNCTVM
jgi:hypothetical protein